MIDWNARARFALNVGDANGPRERVLEGAISAVAKALECAYVEGRTPYTEIEALVVKRLPPPPYPSAE